MAFRVEDLGPLAFGGVVELSKWYDDQRITDGKITDKDVMKKFSTWTFLGLGGVAAVTSAFGVMRQWESWQERIAAGFLYGIPGFVRKVVDAMGNTPTSSRLNAVQEAQRILQQGQAAKQLAEGQVTHRSYQQEFESVSPHAF